MYKLSAHTGDAVFDALALESTGRKESQVLGLICVGPQSSLSSTNATYKFSTNNGGIKEIEGVETQRGHANTAFIVEESS